jgi:hypothetical protein
VISLANEGGISGPALQVVCLGLAVYFAFGFNKPAALVAG